MVVVVLGFQTEFHAGCIWRTSRILMFAGLVPE